MARVSLEKDRAKRGMTEETGDVGHLGFIRSRQTASPNHGDDVVLNACVCVVD